MIARPLASSMASALSFPHIGKTGSLFPPLSTFIAVGDSITDRMSARDTPYNAVKMDCSGWGAALEMLSGQTIKSLARGSTGLGGSVGGNDRDYGMSGITAFGYRLGAAAGAGYEWLGSYVPLNDVVANAASADVIICHIGTNDVGGADAATVASRIFALWDALVATGKPVIGTDILQRCDAYAGWGTTERDKVDAINALLRAGASAHGLRAYRQWNDLITKDGSGYAATTEFPVDYLHPTQRVGFKLGQDLADFLAPYIAGAAPTIPASGSASWVTPNPYVTGGTTLATSWTAASLGTLNTDYTVAKVTDGDGTVWQRLTKITAQAFETVGLYARITSGIPSAGTVCRACARIRVPEGQSMQSIAVMVQQVNAPQANDYLECLSHGGATSASSPLPAVEGLFVSDEFQIQSGVTQVWILIALKNAGSAYFDFRQAGVFKV